MHKLALLVACSFACATALGADASKELSEKRSAIAALPEGTPKADLAKAHYLAGVFARDHGLESEAVAEFRAAVAADASHDAAHRALGEVRCGDRWISHDEAMTMKGLVRRDGSWILTEEAAILDLPAQEKARRKEEQARATKLLSAYGASKDAARKYAADALAGVDDKYKFEPLAWGIRSKSTDVRLYAAKELGRIGDRRALRPLLWRTLHDPDENVRAASIAAAKSIGDPNLLAPLVTALWAENAQVRVNAAQSIGNLGDVAGVKYLVYRFEAHGGSSQRVYYTNVRQVSFIQDFDVEVAQTAFIADPVVGTIQEGLVLDVQVIATSAEGVFLEREAVHSSLRRLTGATDVKNESGAWASWWKEHHAEFETAAR
jgi:HEAT repeat protein